MPQKGLRILACAVEGLCPGRGLCPTKQKPKRTTSTQWSQLEHPRPITSPFLARHEKSSALLARP